MMINVALHHFNRILVCVQAPGIKKNLHLKRTSATKAYVNVTTNTISKHLQPLFHSTIVLVMIIIIMAQ